MSAYFYLNLKVLIFLVVLVTFTSCSWDLLGAVSIENFKNNFFFEISHQIFRLCVYFYQIEEIFSFVCLFNSYPGRTLLWNGLIIIFVMGRLTHTLIHSLISSLTQSMYFLTYALATLI